MAANTNIVIVAGGSFQGKSLAALTIAYDNKYSGVLSTDSIRNFLKVNQPYSKHLSTTTFALTDQDLLQQMKMVSDTVREMIDIYCERGEKIVIEGMHFSEEFYQWSSKQPLKRICMNNLLPFSQRVKLKAMTRTCLEFDEATNEYSAVQARITEIHNRILKQCAENSFEIINYTDFDEAHEQIQKHLGHE